MPVSRKHISILVTAGLAVLALYLFVAQEAPDIPDADRSRMEPQIAAKIQDHRERVLEEPASHGAWGELAVVFQAHGLNLQAAACYQEALELAPSAFRWHYLLVHALRTFDRDAALEASARALAVRSDYTALLVVHAELLEEAEDLEEVAPLYEKALSLEPTSASAELGLGRLAMTRGDLESAQWHLERAVQLSPDAGAVHATLARLYRRLGENEKAIEEARRASLSREPVGIVDPIHYRMTQEAISSTAQLLRARDLEDDADFVAAEAIYRSLVALRPDDADMKVRLGDVLSRLDRHPEAKEHYRAALTIKPEDARAHFGLGAAMSLEGNFDDAARHFQESLRARSDHVPTLVALASILGFRGRVDEALEHYNEALEWEPYSVATHRSLAEFLLRQKRYDEAAGHYRKVLEIEPDVGVVHLQLGACLAMTEEYEQAWSHLERARELGQTIPEAVRQKVEVGLGRRESR